jgi:hypothetical protein
LEQLGLSIRIERRWPLWGALILAGGWAVVAGIAAVGRMPPQPSVAEISGLALALLPPLALVLIVWALLPSAQRTLALADVEDRLGEARAQVTALEDQLGRVDAALANNAVRARDIAAVASHETQGLSASAAALVAAAEQVAGNAAGTRAVTDGMMAVLPEIARTMAAVEESLRVVGADSGTQMRALEAMVAAVQVRGRGAMVDADAAIANLTGLLARIDEASSRNTAALAKRAYALDAAVDGVLERSTAAVDHIREQVEQRLAAVSGQVEDAGRRLTSFGDDGARVFEQRIEQLQRTSEQLRGEFEAHDSLSERLHAVVGERVEDIQRRFGLFDAAGNATVDGIGARIAAFHDRLAAMQERLEASQAIVVGLDDQSGRLGQTVAYSQDMVAARLAETREAMVALDAEAQRLLASVGAIGQSVAEGAAQIGAAAESVAAERGAMKESAEQIERHFEAARESLAEIRDGSSAAAAVATADLGAGLERFAAAADTTTAELRTALAAVTENALATLQAAGADGSAAFAAPVRAELAAIEAATARAGVAGQEVSRRMAGHMLSLIETVSTAEARVAEVETRFAVRARDSLAARSMRLIGQLNESLVDVAQLLTLTVGDAEWSQYLKGDRGVFARVVSPQFDREMSRRVARLFHHDPAFRSEATRYIEYFEALIGRMVGDRDGEALAATMLSSDMGKIYVALCDAIERLPPAREA